MMRAPHHRRTMERTTGVAVLATNLAAADRRGLSQAWYSALHVVEHGSHAERAARAAAVARVPDRPPAAAPAPAAKGSDGKAMRAPHAPARNASAANDTFAERRRSQTPLARSLERALRRRRPVPTALTIAAAGGRVRLLVRADGTATRVVVLCPDAMRESVSRALAHARYALVRP